MMCGPRAGVLDGGGRARMPAAGDVEEAGVGLLQGPGEAAARHHGAPGAQQHRPHVRRRPSRAGP